MIKLLLAIHKLTSLYKKPYILSKIPNINKEEKTLHESFFSLFYTDIKTKYVFKSKNNIIYEFQYTNPKQGTDGLYIRINNNEYFGNLLYRKTIYNCFGDYFNKLNKNIENKIIEDVKELNKLRQLKEGVKMVRGDINI